MRARPLLVALLLLGLSGVAEGQSHSASIRGGVVRLPTRESVAGVRIRLTGTGRSAVSDSAGRFEFLGLAEGGYRLEASAHGFLPVSLPIRLARDERVDLGIELDADSAVRLPEIVVSAPVVSALDAKLEGYYRRMHEGQGHFITPQTIAAQRPTQLSSVLRWVPGLSVDCRNMAANACIVRFDRSGPKSILRECPVLFFLDGVRLGTLGESLDALVPGYQVAAVEAYRGLGDLPQEFDAGGAECGVVAIWLKPSEPRKKP